MLTLFKNQNFSKLFWGRVITNAGDSLYAVAAMWLVYELGGSTFLTGLAGFLVLFPQTLQFLAGPLVDRWSLRNTLVVTQIIQGTFVAIIPVAAFFDLLNVVFVLVVMPIIALLNQFVYPAQTAALPTILSKDELVKGNSAFSFAYQGVDLAFNALAGVLVAVVGATTLFIIDSITFALAAILFSLLKLPARNKDNSDNNKLNMALKRYKEDLVEGIHFVWNSILAKFFLGSIIANGAIGITLAVMPAYADLRGGPEFYGAYLAAISTGVLIGALTASFFSKMPLGKLGIISFGLGGLLWISSSITLNSYVSILLFGFAWIPVGVTNVIMVAAMQRMIPDRLLGRVFAVMGSISTIAMPIGSLLGGTIATALSSQVVIGSTGFGFIFVSMYWLFVSVLRQLPPTDKLDPYKYGFNDHSA